MLVRLCGLDGYYEPFHTSGEPIRWSYQRAKNADSPVRRLYDSIRAGELRKHRTGTLAIAKENCVYHQLPALLPLTGWRPFVLFRHPFKAAASAARAFKHAMDAPTLLEKGGNRGLPTSLHPFMFLSQAAVNAEFPDLPSVNEASSLSALGRAGLAWGIGHRMLRSYAQHHGLPMVFYEDLVENTFETTRRLADVLGLPYDLSKEAALTSWLTVEKSGDYEIQRDTATRRMTDEEFQQLSETDFMKGYSLARSELYAGPRRPDFPSCVYPVTISKLAVASDSVAVYAGVDATPHYFGSACELVLSLREMLRWKGPIRIVDLGLHPDQADWLRRYDVDVRPAVVVGWAGCQRFYAFAEMAKQETADHILSMDVDGWFQDPPESAVSVLKSLDAAIGAFAEPILLGEWATATKLRDSIPNMIIERYAIDLQKRIETCIFFIGQSAALAAWWSGPFLDALSATTRGWGTDMWAAVLAGRVLSPIVVSDAFAPFARAQEWKSTYLEEDPKLGMCVAQPNTPRLSIVTHARRRKPEFQFINLHADIWKACGPNPRLMKASVADGIL